MTGPINPRNCTNLVLVVLQKCRAELGAADANVQSWLDEMALRDEATADLAHTIDISMVQTFQDIDFDAIRRVRDAADKVLELAARLESTCAEQQELQDDTSREDATDAQFEAANVAAAGVSTAVNQLNTYARHAALTDVGPIVNVSLDTSDGGRTPVIDFVQDNLNQWLAYSSAQGRGALVDKFHDVHAACIEFRKQTWPFRALKKRVREDRAEAKEFILLCAQVETERDELMAEYRAAVEAAL